MARQTAADKAAAAEAAQAAAIQTAVTAAVAAALAQVQPTATAAAAAPTAAAVVTPTTNVHKVADNAEFPYVTMDGTCVHGGSITVSVIGECGRDGATHGSKAGEKPHAACGFNVYRYVLTAGTCTNPTGCGRAARKSGAFRAATAAEKKAKATLRKAKATAREAREALKAARQ